MNRVAIPSSEADVVWFGSKLDWWLAGILTGLPVICAVSLISLLLAGENVLAVLAPCIFVAAIYIGLLFPTRYGIGPHQLVVRNGFMRRRIQLGSILEVRRTRNPLSSPALSLDRLRIKYGPGMMSFILISPADQAGFRDLLAERTGNPRLLHDA